MLLVANILFPVCRVPISKSATLRTLFLPYWSAIILGPITYLLLILHMALSYRFKKARIILESLVSTLDRAGKVHAVCVGLWSPSIRAQAIENS